MGKLEDDLNGLQEIIKVFENLLASSSFSVLFDKMLGRHICLAWSCDFSSFMANKDA